MADSVDTGKRSSAPLNGRDDDDMVPLLEGNDDH